MQTTVNLEIPNEVTAKLVTGEYKRTGGVIQDNSGKVVMWLREGSLSPSSPSSLPSQLPPKMGSILNMAGSVTSVLNLGATIAFGMATLSKLGKIDEKLDVIVEKLEEIEQKINQIQWSIDIGFANTLQALESLKQYQEIGLAGELNSATNLAWSCQFLEPNSTQRIMRIEQAFAKSSSVVETLLIHTENEMKEAINWIENRRKKSSNFEIDDIVINALYRFRQTCLACSINANIQAETGDTYSVGIKLHKDQERLFQLIYQLANLSIAMDDGKSYQVLFDKNMSDVMPIHRISLWIERFDNKNNSLHNVLEILRDKGFKNTLLVEEDKSNENSIGGIYGGLFAELEKQNKPKKKKINHKINKNTSVFFDLIDGIYEDLDRLKGSALEYKTMHSMGVSIHEYRDSLRINNIGNGNDILFISLDENKINHMQKNSNKPEYATC